MPSYLFIFGYESPVEAQTNDSEGTDFESSHAVWIDAPDESTAIMAGRRSAEHYAIHLFEKEGAPGYSWTEANFAHWIEHQPLQRYSGLALETFERIFA